MSFSEGCGATFFNTTVNKIIILLPGNQMNRMNVYYPTTDCTGIAYRAEGSQLDNEVNYVWSSAPGRYFIINQESGIQQLILHSYTEINFDQLICRVSDESNTFVKLDPINLPFTEPATSPLQLKYQ
ncbi:hypothetical protein HY025_03170 [Candidatus Daviesbacteria bacterium]|nr:hypothetical protein [Candidatus Daviesbacteria bacterium]